MSAYLDRPNISIRNLSYSSEAGYIYSIDNLLYDAQSLEFIGFGEELPEDVTSIDPFSVSPSGSKLIVFTSFTYGPDAMIYQVNASGGLVEITSRLLGPIRFMSVDILNVPDILDISDILDEIPEQLEALPLFEPDNILVNHILNIFNDVYENNIEITQETYEQILQIPFTPYTPQTPLVEPNIGNASNIGNAFSQSYPTLLQFLYNLPIDKGKLLYNNVLIDVIPFTQVSEKLAQNKIVRYEFPTELQSLTSRYNQNIILLYDDEGKKYIARVKYNAQSNQIFP